MVPPAGARRTRAPRRAGSTSALEGWLSGIDGRGDRLVWIVRAQRERRASLVLTAILNEPAGLRDVTLAELPRKSLRRMQDDLRARHAVQMVTADGAYCDALVAEGYERARAAGSAEAVGQYPTLRARLTGQAPAPLTPAPLIARVAAETLADTRAAADGAALLDEIEFVTWLLERDGARAATSPRSRRRARARSCSADRSRKSASQAALADARRELFGGDAPAVYRRRLEEMAYVLHASGRPRARAPSPPPPPRAWRTRGDDAIPFFTELAPPQRRRTGRRGRRQGTAPKAETRCCPSRAPRPRPADHLDARAIRAAGGRVSAADREAFGRALDAELGAVRAHLATEVNQHEPSAREARQQRLQRRPLDVASHRRCRRRCTRRGRDRRRARAR